MNAKINEVVEGLLKCFQEKQYLTEDEVADFCIDHDLDLLQIDEVCNRLLGKNIFLRDELDTSVKKGEEEDYVDRSHRDYVSFLDKVICEYPNMRHFVEEVRKIPPPQTREWKILVVQARNGNDCARERLILMYIRTIMKNVYDFSCANHTNFEDSFQDGIIGLITAVEKYDVTSPETFVSYFPMWGWQGMSRYAIFSGAATTYPVHVKEKIYKIFARTRELSEFLELDKIDEYYSWKELLEMAEDEYAVRNMLPYIELTEESEIFSESPYVDIEDLEIKNIINDVLSTLKEKERKVLELRFGLLDGIERTLEEVGTEFGVTRERIRQIEVKAINKLKNNRKLRSLKNFISWQ